MAIHKRVPNSIDNLNRRIRVMLRAARNHGLGFGGDHLTLQAVTATSNAASGAVANGSGGGLAAFLGGWGSILGVAITAAFSAGITQLHYRDELDEIKRLYEDEISEKLGKSVDKVTVKDLDLLGKGDPARGIAPNATIAEALGKAKKFRNLSVVTTGISSLATLGITSALVMAFPALGAASLGAFLAEAAIGIVVYNVIRVPLNTLGKKIFGIARENTTERIMEIEKNRESGKDISREQVLSVLVSANPDLDQRVANSFGKKFDDMSTADKEKVVESLRQVIPLDQITTGINQGGVDITRLAFTTEQQTTTTTTTTADYMNVSSGMPSGTGFARREEIRRGALNSRGINL
jgi:hypothetical protein